MKEVGVVGKRGDSLWVIKGEEKGRDRGREKKERRGSLSLRVKGEGGGRGLWGR